jgi:hypothetical protein
MGRLVEPRPANATVRADAGGARDVKDYLERVAKYVPAEILAGYLTLLPIIVSTTDGQPNMRLALQALVLVAFLILTPFYFVFMAEPGKPKRLHIAVATAAFVIWAYYQGAFFATIGAYHAGLAAVVLVIFTLASGLLAPTEGSD